MGNSATSGLSYTLGDEVVPKSREGWVIFDAVSKADKSPITVFKHSASTDSRENDLAENAFKMMKKLRHPYVLKYQDGGQVGKDTFVATERVIPLMQWLETAREQETKERLEAAVTWGIYCVGQALSFVNKDCKFVHGNVCPESIFVTRGGDWVLGGLGLVAEGYSRLKDFSTHVPNKYKAPERLRNDWASLDSSPPWALDAWGLGCIIFEVFNGLVEDAEELLNVDKIPRNFRTIYKRLLSSAPNRRPDPADLAKAPQVAKCVLVQRLIALDEFHIQSQEEKIAFIKTFTNELSQFPEASWYKFLVGVSSVFAMQSTGPNGAVLPGIGALHTAALEPLLAIGTKLTHDEYERLVTPRVVQLFASIDRGIRLALLQRLSSYIDHLDEKLINGTLFHNLATGFSDSAPLLRELTIKAMVRVAPKLDSINLNDKLMRYFATLQNDKEAAIRTNTVICLGMIFVNLKSETQVKVLIGAFTKAVRDPFPHARVAAIKAISGNLKPALGEQYTEATSKVLPLICVALGDPSPEVRVVAFECIQTAMPWLKVQSDLRSVEQKEAAAAAAVKQAEEEAERLRLRGVDTPVSYVGVGEVVADGGVNTTSGGFFTAATGWAAATSIASRWTAAPKSTSASASLASSTAQSGTGLKRTDESGRLGRGIGDDKDGEDEEDKEDSQKRVQDEEVRRVRIEKQREEQRKRRQERAAKKYAGVSSSGGLKLGAKKLSAPTRETLNWGVTDTAAAAPATTTSTSGEPSGWGDDYNDDDLFTTDADEPAVVPVPAPLAAAVATATKVDASEDDFFAQMINGGSGSGPVARTGGTGVLRRGSKQSMTSGTSRRKNTGASEKPQGAKMITLAKTDKDDDWDNW